MSDRRDHDPAVLERNIERLLTRAWQPPAVREDFRADLERRCVARAAGRWAPPAASESPSAAPSGPWRWALVAAAAALLVWLGSGPTLLEGFLGGRTDGSDAMRGAADRNTVASGPGLPAAVPDGPVTPSAAERPGSSDFLSRLFGPGEGRRLAALPGIVEGGSDDPSADGEAEAGSAPSALAVAVIAPGDAVAPTRFEVAILRAAQLPDVAAPELFPIDLGTAPADAEGAPRALLQDLTAGRHVVHVYAEGFAPWRREVDLPAGGFLELEARLERGGVATGRVLDALTGEPIEGALVISEFDLPLQVLSPDLESDDEDVPMVTATTDPDGRFRLAPLSSGPHRLRATAPGRAPRWVECDVPPEGGGAVEVPTFELGAAATVRGRAEDEFGRPRAGAVVVVSYFESPGGTRKGFFGAAEADEAGEYEVGGLPAGMHVVLLFETSAPVAPRAMVPLFLRGGDERRVDFVPDGRGAVVSGSVVDAEGRPLSGHAMTLSLEVVHVEEAEGVPSWTSTTSDDDGRFEFRDVRAGRYGLFGGELAGSELVRYADVSIAAGVDRDLRVVRPAGAVRGTVTTFEGVPASDTTVFLLAELAGSGTTFIGRQIADPDGSFEFLGVDPGEHRLFFLPARDDLAATVQGPITVAADGDAVTTRTELVPGGSIEVRCNDVNGEPLDRVDIDLIDPDGFVVFDDGRFHTRPDGVALIGSLGPGAWRVRAKAPGFTTAERSVTAVAGETRSLTITLIPETP